jgi:hypothetical protein
MSTRVNLLEPAVRANPYPHYAEMRRNSPVCQVDPGASGSSPAMTTWCPS